MKTILTAFCLFCLPLRQITLTSAFGFRIHPVTGKYRFHDGIDLRARKDTVFAVLAGVVQAAGYQPLFGVYIRVDHGKFQTSYGHLSQLFVIPGDSVLAGQPIAVSGATGLVTAGHLHFSVLYHHRNIDPLKFLLNISNKIN
ncbi:MAG: mepM 4 [Mucilaginibacter sp.]|nr:mepM 4 [Mucilaginibacter sp.]